MPDWVIILIVLGAGVGLALVILSRVRYKRNYQAFASASSLQLHYQNRREFSLKGEYSGYPLAINPWLPPLAPDEAKTSKGLWLRLDVPLSNPNNKYLRISKGVEQESWHDMFVHPDAVKVQHSYGEGVEIESSDMLFSSFVMTEEVRARTGVFLAATDRAVVAIQGNALFALIPNTLADTQAWKPVAEAMTLLTEIKQALNN